MSLRWIAAYSFLLLTIHEAHELAHAVTGKIVCDEWPLRDFNAWRFAGGCTSWLPTLAGPLFSYALMLAGAILASKSASRWTGVALLFAANPFARIFTAAVGGGDEMVVASRLAGTATRTPALRAMVLLVVLAICGSAVVAGWRAMSALPRRAVWFAFVLLWPMIMTGVLLFVIGNRLLRAGVLAEPAIAGTPPLVWIASTAFLVGATVTLRWLHDPRSAVAHGE
jgi:hypothetical protein